MRGGGTGEARAKAFDLPVDGANGPGVGIEVGVSPGENVAALAGFRIDERGQQPVDFKKGFLCIECADTGRGDVARGWKRRTGSRFRP